VTDVSFTRCPLLQQQQQQQQADKHDVWDMRRSDTNEQSDEKTLQPIDNAADLTVQNATKSSLDDLPPLFGSAVSALYTAASGTCLTKKTSMPVLSYVASPFVCDLLASNNNSGVDC
jgi:hypothetical protein